jgi:hypothetical protein
VQPVQLQLQLIGEYLKIYPPNQTQPVQISFKGSACASSWIKILQNRRRNYRIQLTTDGPAPGDRTLSRGTVCPEHAPRGNCAVGRVRLPGPPMRGSDYHEEFSYLYDEFFTRRKKFSLKWA